MSARELPEIRYASKGRLLEKEIRKSASEQDRKSKVLKRQIDRNIYLAAKELNDIQTRTPSQPRRLGTPNITISDVDNHHHHHNNNNDHTPARTPNNNNESDSDTHLVHLCARTRRNLLLSQKLSRSLEKMEEKRAQSPRLPPPSACKESGVYRPVSCRSMNDLQRAAAVLRFTEYEDDVQQLMSSVSVKDKLDHA